MMDKTKINETLRRNVTELSKQTEREVSMMPATVAPLPSVDMVKRIVALVKNIIFPDYFEKRQPDEAIRSYHIGVAMEELVKLLTKQIAHGLQFCEHCEGERTKDQVYGEAEKKALAFCRKEKPEKAAITIRASTSVTENVKDALLFI